MHAIQEELVTLGTLNDDEMVEMVIAAWQTVCEENESQRHLVTDTQWNQWVQYKTATTGRLDKAVDSYKEGTLSEEARGVFDSIAREIIRAGHKTAPELVEEARKASESASHAVLETPNAPVKELAATTRKSRWKTALKKILGRR